MTTKPAAVDTGRGLRLAKSSSTSFIDQILALSMACYAATTSLDPADQGAATQWSMPIIAVRNTDSEEISSGAPQPNNVPTHYIRAGQLQQQLEPRAWATAFEMPYRCPKADSKASTGPINCQLSLHPKSVRPSTGGLGNGGFGRSCVLATCCSMRRRLRWFPAFSVGDWRLQAYRTGPCRADRPTKRNHRRNRRLSPHDRREGSSPPRPHPAGARSVARACGGGPRRTHSTAKSAG
jgi:hypothetical protein